MPRGAEGKYAPTVWLRARGLAASPFPAWVSRRSSSSAPSTSLGDPDGNVDVGYLLSIFLRGTGPSPVHHPGGTSWVTIEGRENDWPNRPVLLPRLQTFRVSRRQLKALSRSTARSVFAYAMSRT